ncbi:THAP domain-containing protein 4, partial [Harpegnathos saltator]
RFPLKDENRLHKWIAVSKKPNWKSIKNSKICSLHFSRNDIIAGMGYTRVILRPDAVP